MARAFGCGNGKGSAVRAAKNQRRWMFLHREPGPAPEIMLASHRPAVSSETGTGMDAAETLADQFARGENLLGAVSIKDSVVTVRGVSPVGNWHVKKKFRPVRDRVVDPPACLHAEARIRAAQAQIRRIAL
jgi:hypothetical protein